MILIITLTLSLLASTQSFTSQAPTWYTHPDFRAGSYRVINSIIGPSGSPPNWYFTFSTALTTSPPFLAYGFKGYRGTDYLLQEYVTMKCLAVNQVSFYVEVAITNVTYPILVDVIYIAINSNYPYHLNVFYDVPIDYASTLVNITTNSTTLQYYTNYLDYTNDLAFGATYDTFTSALSDYRIALFMTAFGFTSTALIPFYLDVQATVTGPNNYMLNATFGYQATCTRLTYSHVIFDASQYSVYGNLYLYFYEWTVTSTLATNNYYQLSTILQNSFIMGLKSFAAVSGQCTLEYQWNYLTYVSGGSSVTGLQISPSTPYVGSCGLSSTTSTIFYMMSWTCASPYVFFNITAMMCQTSCGSFTYTNYTDYTCRPCLNTLCYSCDFNNSNICLSCPTNWVISGTTCVCDTSSGTTWFINGTCYACGDLHTQCQTCDYAGDISLVYDSTKFTCMTCYGAAGYFITPLDTCATCNVTYCTTCIGYSSCQVCNSGYGVTITGSCSTCPLDGCQTCANLTTCSLCIGEYLSIGGLCYSCPVTCTCGGYTLPKYTNGDCATICGDGIVLGPYETCDDGNLVNGDGCSSTCKIEDSSVCSGEPSTCYLNKDLQVSFVRSEVSPTSCNLITFTFQIQPALSVLNTLNISWNGFITSNSSYLSMQGSPTYSNAVLKLTYMYNSTIQSQLVVFNVNVQSIRNASTYLSQIHNTSLQVQVQPTNNLAAVYCSSAVKTQAFGYGISAVGYLGMLLSIFSCKIVGLQMFGVMQLSYFALSDYEYVNPVLSGVLNRRQVNGLNIQPSSSTNYKLSGRLLVNGFTSEHFLSNYNIMFLLTIILTVVGLTLYSITYFINRESLINQQLSEVLHSEKSGGDQSAEVPRSQYWHNFSKFILKEVLLTFIIFNIFNLGFATGVQIYYIDEVDPYSIICMLVALSLMVVVGVAQLVTDKLEFGEYTLKFKEARYESKYILATMLYRFTLGLLMALLNEWTPCCIVFVFLSGAFLTYICYFDPFNEQMQNRRSKIVHAVHVLILFVAFYYRLESNYDAVESNSLLVPAYLQLIAVGFVVLGSTLMLSYEVYVKIRDWLQSRQPSHKIEDNSVRQKEQDKPNVQFETVEYLPE